MTTAYTSLLGLALPVTGELSGTWGQIVNDSITSLLDSAVAGTTTLSTDADVTLTTTTGAANTAREAILLFSGARTALRTITAPAASKIYTVINATTGGFGVKLVGAGPTTGLTIPAGASAVVAWNGSDFVEIGSTTLNSLTVTGNLTVNGTSTLTGAITNTAGTANGVAYLNGSKVLTTGTALTFDGTNLALGINGGFRSDFSGNGLIVSKTNVGPVNAIRSVSNTSDVLLINDSSSGFANTAFYASGSEQMRLTSTGLGIGTSSPVSKLSVFGSAATSAKLIDIGGTTTGFSYASMSNTGGLLWFGLEGSSAAQIFGGSSAYASVLGTANATPLQLGTNGTVRATLDSAGNLGLGVTPSAWASGFTALELRSGVSWMTQNGSPNSWQLTNAYYDGAFKRKTANAATGYNQSGGVHSWYNAASGAADSAITFTQAMTLDASGNLGIGTSSPSQKLQINGSSPRILLQDAGTGAPLIDIGSGGGSFYVGSDNSAGSVFGTSAYARLLWGIGAYPMLFATNNTERMRLDSAGNLGLGVTPSAWFANSKVIQFGVGGALESRDNNPLTAFSSNSYIDTSGNYKYITTNSATRYGQSNGQHIWQTAPSGTAGNAISFTQAMTLDASGNLLVGQTSSTDASFRLQLTGAGGSIHAAMGTNSNALRFSNVNTSGVEWAVGTSSPGVENAGNFFSFTQFSGGSWAERARIDSSGNLLVAKTTAGSVTSNGAELSSTGYVVFCRDSPSGFVEYVTNNNASGTGLVEYRRQSTVVGSITTNGTLTTYNTTSDYRLKTVVSPVANAGQRIDALQPVEYTWNSDGSQTRGFLAHQFQEVYANSVSGTKDAVDAEGNPVYQAMQAGSAEVIADLVAEIQSLRKRLAAAGL